MVANMFRTRSSSSSSNAVTGRVCPCKIWFPQRTIGKIAPPVLNSSTVLVWDGRPVRLPRGPLGMRGLGFKSGHVEEPGFPPPFEVLLAAYVPHLRGQLNLAEHTV